jgi:CBS domain-containing protein
MKTKGIGDVLVRDNGKICGIVTDRDLVVRALAEGVDPQKKRLGEMCTEQVVSVAPNDDVEMAVKLMRKHAIRRLPVLDNGKLVGIVSLGDLAAERDEKSALGQISKAPDNN